MMYRCHLTLLIIVSAILAMCMSLLVRGDCKADASPVIKAFMAIETSAVNSNERYNWLLNNFTNKLFLNTNAKIEFEISKSPAADVLCSGRTLSPEQALNFAHYHTWKRFADDKLAGCRDSLLIFQHDAVIGREDAGALVLNHLRHGMPEDIMFFGYCFKSVGIPKFLKQRRYNKYHPRVTSLAPHCLHSYGVALNGAKILTKEIDPCGKSVDLQIAELTDVKKLLTFNYSNITFDHFYMHNQFDMFGMHMKHDDDYGPNRDGIFAQVDPDVAPPQYLDGTASYLVGTRAGSMFILVNQTWRHIPNMDMHTRLLDGTPKGTVKVMTDWQLSHHPEGPPLTESDVNSTLPLIKKYIASL